MLVLKVLFLIWRYDLVYFDMLGIYLMFRCNRYLFFVLRWMVYFGIFILFSLWKVSDWFGVKLVKVL